MAFVLVQTRWVWRSRFDAIIKVDTEGWQKNICCCENIWPAGMHCLSLQNAEWGSLPPRYVGGAKSRRGTDRHSGLTGNLFRIRTVYLHLGHERVYRQGHPAEPCIMTFDLFRLLFDYYSLCDRENSFEPLRRNGSKLFCIPPYFVRHTWKPAKIRSTRVRPHNSDSEGRRFEFCRACQTELPSMMEVLSLSKKSRKYASYLV